LLAVPGPRISVKPAKQAWFFRHESVRRADATSAINSTYPEKSPVENVMVADPDVKRDLGRNRELNSQLINLSRRELINSLDRYRITSRGVEFHPGPAPVPPCEGGVRHEGHDGRGQGKGRHDLG
jgi:hypothetical protein